jgi:hypothetical protein
VVFGLTISSSWGNGHATLWRGLCRALARRGHRVVFFEQDVPYYAENRDLHAVPGGELVLYSDWSEIRARAAREVAEAEVAMVTSYCPHGIEATALVRDARGTRVFYDLDTPVTLARLKAGEPVSYIGPEGLAGFDLVLSYTGGAALDTLRRDPRREARRSALRPCGSGGAPAGAAAGAVRERPLLSRHLCGRPAGGARDAPRGAGAASVGAALPHRRRAVPGRLPLGREHLLRAPPAAGRPPGLLLVLATHPQRHPPGHGGHGLVPSGRLFEAAACGTPLLSDAWEGLDAFFTPGREVLTARTAEDAVAALDLSDAELRRIGQAGRERVLGEHTSDHRAAELEALLSDAAGPAAPASELEEA